MRGKVNADGAKEAETGITPAYAGKSFISNLNSSNDKDHPRLCGEK